MPKHRTRCILVAGVHLAALGVLAIAGCSTVAKISLNQACTDYAQIDRGREASCYGVAPEPDESTLVAREIESCVMVSNAPGSQTDANFWETCAGVADNDCGGYECTFPPGTRNIGEPCLLSVQCATLFCKGTLVVGAGAIALPDALECGTCAALVAEGASCDVTTDACEIGSSCFQGMCRKRGVEGDACTVWNDCAFPEWVCKTDGICDSITPDGSPCSTSNDCTTNTGCDAVTKLCTPAAFGQPGDTCDGAVHRCEAGLCDLMLGVCPTVSPDGTTCDPTDPTTVCDDYAVCFRGTCRVPSPSTCQ